MHVVAAPFHAACRLGRVECVQCLVRCGCDTAMETADGRTGRDLAAAAGHSGVLTLLDGALAALKAQRQEEKKTRRKKQKVMRAVLAKALRSVAKKGAVNGIFL